MVYEKYETFDFKFGKSIYVVEQKPHKPIVIEIVHNLEYGLPVAVAVVRLIHNEGRRCSLGN